jgi:hypothetical protein
LGETQRDKEIDGGQVRGDASVLRLQICFDCKRADRGPGPVLGPEEVVVGECGVGPAQLVEEVLTLWQRKMAMSLFC